MKIEVIMLDLFGCDCNCQNCALAEVPHCHRCDGCLTIWQHCSPPQSASVEVWDKAHACPRCGTDQRYKYRLRPGDVIDFPWKGNEQ